MSSQSIHQLLAKRERCTKLSSVRKSNWHILRKIVTGSCVQQIGEYVGSGSYSRIIYCEGYLLTNGTSKSSSLQIHSLNGKNGKPMKKIMKLTLPEDWKDRDFGIGPIACSNSFADGFRIFLYAVTAHQLLCIDFHNGLIVSQAQLPEGSRYTELSIDDETHSLAVSSVKNPKGDLLMNFAIYSYFPKLKFQGLLKIKKSVFGETITGAEVNQGLLLLFHKGNRVKIHSLLSAKENQDSCPPLLMDVVSFNHIVTIGANPYYRIHATHYNSFRISRLDDETGACETLEGQDNSFDPYIGFHPDSSPRLIFVDNGALRLYDIVKNAEGVHALSLSATHSLEVAKLNPETSLKTSTISGRAIKRPSYTEIYSRTSYEDTSSFLAWDYEDDLNIIGVLYAQYDENGIYMDLALDILDSPTGKVLRRFQLLSKLRVLSKEPPEVFLRLDADLCLVSLSRNGRAIIRVFRFIF